MITPNLYFEFLGRRNLRSELCLAGKPFQDEVAWFTTQVIVMSIFTLLVGHKLLCKTNETFWFSLRSHYWWPNLVFVGSLVVYQFSQSLLMCVTVFPLMHFSTNLWRTKSFKDLVISIAGIVIITGVTILLLFGSLLANPQAFGVEKGGLFSMLMREAIMDYDCAGSNIWVYLCLHIFPSLIVFLKVLTD